VTRLTAAEQLLRELGITEPEEIDLEAIAWHVKATVKYRPLDGCEARIVGAGDRAIITVNASSPYVRQRFSIGHEIGHWYYHRGRSLICRSEDIGGHKDENGGAGVFLERQADAFAADLLLPGYVLHLHLLQFKALNFDTVRKVARTFNTSLPATAIRLVEQGSWPAILTCYGQKRRKWFVHAPSVPRSWFPKDDLSAESHAFGLLYGNEPDQARPRTIGAHAWFDRRDAERHELQEQSIRTTEGDVLSLLLMTDTGMLAADMTSSGYCFRR
jgi:hypothetical protein